MLSYSWKRARLSLKRKRNKVEFELKKEQIENLKRLEDSIITCCKRKVSKCYRVNDPQK